MLIISHTCNYSIIQVWKINAVILAILSYNLIDGMIIAVVIATELKQFQINYQNCNDHICI